MFIRENRALKAEVGHILQPLAAVGTPMLEAWFRGGASFFFKLLSV